MELNYISDLHPRRKNWIIQAKVLSTWVLCEFFTKKVLLLADEKGDTIEATIVFTQFEYEIPRFIKDGEWYSLSDFKVIKPTLKERNTTHPYQIKVWEKTKMNLVQPITCKNYFRFEDFADINHARVNDGVTFDVCGCIIEVSEIIEEVSVVPEDGRTNHCEGVVIKLLNGRNETLKCHAMGGYASYFMRMWKSKNYHLTFKSKPVFSVFRFWKIVELKGTPCIVNTYGSSRIYINPEFAGLKNHKAISEFAGRYHLNQQLKNQDESSSSKSIG